VWVWSLGADWLIAAGSYPDFCCMKQLGVFLLPLDRMLVHRGSLPHNLFGFHNNSQIPIYTPGWREAMWELRVLPENKTQCPRPGLEPGPLDPGTSALIMRPPHLHINQVRMLFLSRGLLNSFAKLKLKGNLQSFLIHVISTCSIGYELNTAYLFIKRPDLNFNAS